MGRFFVLLGIVLHLHKCLTLKRLSMRYLILFLFSIIALGYINNKDPDPVKFAVLLDDFHEIEVGDVVATPFEAGNVGGMPVYVGLENISMEEAGEIVDCNLKISSINTVLKRPYSGISKRARDGLIQDKHFNNVAFLDVK